MASTYVYEISNINDVSEDIRNADRSRTVALNDPDLVTIERLRLIGGGEYLCPFVDVSYCWGRMKDGERVNVRLPFHQLQKRGRGSYARQIVGYFQQEGRHAKKMGALSSISYM